MVAYTELKARLIMWVREDFLQCIETHQEHTMTTKEVVGGTHCPTSRAVCSLLAFVSVHPTFDLRQDEMEGLVLGSKLLRFLHKDVLTEAFDVNVTYCVRFPLLKPFSNACLPRKQQRCTHLNK